MAFTLFRVRTGAVALLMLAACDRSPGSPTGGQAPTMLAFDRLDIVEGHGLYVGRRDARDVRIAFSLPVDRVEPSRLHDVERLGMSADGQVVVLVDRYATRARGARCAARRESWLRVFSLTGRGQLLAIPVESCRDEIATRRPVWLGEDRFRLEGSPPVTYQIDGGTIRRL